MAKTAIPSRCTLEYYKGVNSISVTVIPDVVGMLSWRDYRIKGSWSRAPWEREVGSHTRALLCGSHMRALLCGYVGLPGPPGWRSRKESACQRRRRERGGLIPGAGNSSPLQCLCLEKSMDRGAWWATVHGAVKVRCDLVTEHACMHTHTHTHSHSHTHTYTHTHKGIQPG